MDLIYQTGDVLESAVESGTIKVIPHIVNDIGGWGAGFVVALSNKWTQPEAAYRKWHKDGFCRQFGADVPFALGNTQFVRIPDINTVVVNMISQHQTVRKGYKPIRYASLVHCMETVATFATNMKNKGHEIEIHAPKFGSGLAGGNWKFIEELIYEIWLANLIKVNIFSL